MIQMETTRFCSASLEESQALLKRRRNPTPAISAVCGERSFLRKRIVVAQFPTVRRMPLQLTETERSARFERHVEREERRLRTRVRLRRNQRVDPPTNRTQEVGGSSPPSSMALCRGFEKAATGRPSSCNPYANRAMQCWSPAKGSKSAARGPAATRLRAACARRTRRGPRVPGRRCEHAQVSDTFSA
jgi:hypothetical protein